MLAWMLDSVLWVQYWAQAQAQMQQLNSAMAMVNGGASLSANGVNTNGFHVSNDDERNKRSIVKEEDFTQNDGVNRQGVGLSNHMNGNGMQMGGAMAGWSDPAAYPSYNMQPSYPT